MRKKDQRERETLPLDKKERKKEAKDVKGG